MCNLRSHPPTDIWKEIVNPSGEWLSGTVSSGELNKPPFPATNVRRPQAASLSVPLGNPSSASRKTGILESFSLCRHLSAHRSMNKTRQYSLQLDLRVSLSLYPLLTILKKLLKERMAEMHHSMDRNPERLSEGRTLTGVRC